MPLLSGLGEPAARREPQDEVVIPVQPLQPKTPLPLAPRVREISDRAFSCMGITTLGTYTLFVMFLFAMYQGCVTAGLEKPLTPLKTLHLIFFWL